MRTEEMVDEMVRRIVDRSHPQKIILFGSTACGNNGACSSSGLLVVVQKVLDRRSLRVAMRGAAEVVGLSDNVVVLTSEEFERERWIPGCAAYWAEREGKTLYAA